MREFIMAASSGGEVDMSKYFELFNSDYSLGNAALVAVMGIVVVFAILLVLVVLLTVFEKIFTIKRKNKTQATAVQTDNMSEDEETVAAIIAAITMLYAQESTSSDVVPQFTVRRIKQVSKLNNR